MSVSSQDRSQWLSVTEETLFLHDGLVRVSDLIELPRDVNTSPDGDHELMTFDSKSPEELSEKLMTVCGAQNNAYSRLLEYRLNALRGYWNAQRQIAFEQQNERDTTSHEEALVLLRKHNLWKEPEKASFSTRVSLLLVLPLLQSQSKFDPSLCSITADLLFNCLHDCPALSLSKEPVDCLNGLEKLLSCWLGEDEGDENVERKDSIQKESAAAAFVALACARGHLKMFVHTVHLLLNLKDLRPLPVADLLEKLLETEGGQSQPSSLSGNRHILCWGFEDGLSGHEKQASVSSSTTTTNNANNLPSSGSNVASDKVTDYEIGRSVTSCGKFLYMTSSSGKGLAKIGSGLHGTLRGYIYASNQDMVGCRVAYGSEVLLARTLEMDGDAEIQWLAEVTDTSTLVPLKKLAVPEECVMEGPITTIAFCSDGDYFYWIWSPGVPGDKNAKLQNIFLDCFRYDADSSALTVMKERVLLLRKEEGSVKCLNDTLLARLRPYRSASVAATLVTLTGSESQLPRKEDVTSIGIPLKTLLRTPVYCDGSTVVFLTPAPGGSTSNAARSLFGSGPSLGSLRLACNLCFDVADGMFNTRSDLMDDAACALVRGAQVMGTGLCYDVVNNLIWMVSNDWVDQFCNNGHQALHRILTRLGLDHQQTFNIPKDNMLKPVVIAEKILQHVGAMCLHELNYDIVNLPLSNYVLQHSLDVVHLERVIDIIQYAVGVGDLKMLIVGLIMLQVIFRMNSMNRDDSKVDENINRASKVIWNVFDRYHEISPRTQTLEGAVLREVCNVISTGVSIMYPQANDRWNLLHKLLAEGDRDDGMSHLRDLILIEYSEQLRNQIVNTEEVIFLRLSDELVHYILRIAVKESFQLLQSCKTSDKKEFDKILSSVPMASPCLRYLMALQSHLFRECVLHLDDSGSEESGVPLPKKLIKEDLSDLQSAILTYSSNVFKGAYEVLEMLLETCNSIINNSEIPHLEYWLQGLEHVTKATVLGHLLPVLLTAMTDKNMKCLSIADKLMPQLVQLVILTSQTALLMKNQLEAVRDTAEEKAPDSSITHLIGDTTNLDVEELNDEQEGFLAGLKIPAPWTSGKTVESIHPVRDNYKYKETVHIPGARYLYLRFDPRCSSQYDYDKLVVYAGPNTNSRRVAEYGGNTYGYGSRSVLGSGWPKDLVKVEGDTVTFSFEMRSGREHNTPDKAMWGFLVTVRAQVRDSSEEISGGLPFLVDLALGLSMLTSSMLHLLYEGPEQTKEEKACQNLLKSKLLQRCVWQADGDVKDPPVPLSPGPKSLPRIRLPAEIIAKLREMADRQPPQIRPSIKEAIQPEILEESILSAVIKHFDLTDTVRNITSHEEHQTEEFLLLKDVMSETYKHTYAMIRQLQTIAELEQRWKSEVEDVRQEVMPFQDVFFLDYHLVENKTKELAILCFLKDITMDTTDLDGTVSDLRHKFESEVSCEPDSSVVNTNPKLMPRTRAAVSSVLERLELLLQVNMAPVEGAYTGMIRSISHMTNANKPIDVMIRSDTDVLHTGLARHSVSVPSHIHSVTDDSILDILHLQKSRYAQKSGPTSILQDLIEDDGDRPPHAILIDQLFSFIGSNPENAVSCVSFLSAAEVRRKRGKTRYQALVHMKDLLTGASRVGTATHLVAAVTSVLQYGPRIDELSCGGMANQVQEAFSDTMTSVVQLAASYPMACSNSIGLLCIIPYTRAEEMCLVRSGLVHLLDKLCSLTSHRYEGITSEVQSVRQRISAMAWAGFQVLSDRCVMWERDEDDMEHSGLARQVSMLLTNHLARATQCVGNEAAGSEALQEVLTLLKNLSRSRMGKAILRQPACVSKLLSLLLDQRPSPKLVLIILQLCRVALPLMTTEDCNQVELPAWGQEFYFTCTSEHQENKELKISSLLLAKLGDFLVPGGQVTVSSKHATVESNMEHSKVVCSSDKDKVDDTNVQDGCLSVFVHKREDQSSHEVIQPLLSSESRPFRLAGGGANMEKVVRLDREMTKNGKAEVTTEDAVTALRRAARWAQIGLVVSTAAPGESAAKSPTNSDKKKIAIDVVCKEKNVELARSNPARPFISGHVANSMAAEVIALLHSLLTAPETLAAQCWASAVETVISSALSHLPQLLHSLSDMTSPHCNKDELMVLAKQANAALAALGGFDETIKPGSEVEITGEGLDSCLCSVVTVSEQTGLANVQLLPPTGEDYTPPRYSDTVQVPISRLRTPRNGLQPLSHLSVTEAIVSAVQMILVPQESNMFPISQPLPVHGSDASNLANQICRVVSEIRTRACKVLAAHLQDLSFASSFIQHSSNVVDILKSLAKECHPGDRHPVIQAHCQRLRMLYRDCAKPPPPMGKSVSKPVKEIKWNPSHLFPPLRSCLFSNGLTTVTFFGDPSSGSGLPRGTIVYASQPIPQQAASFYWELEICSFGDSQEESCPVFAFGFMPTAEKKDGAWIYPVGSCLFHNNGRAVHYNGSSLLQWRSVRLDVTLNPGDICGIGWERQSDGSGQSVKGTVFFTYNGRRLSGTIEEALGNMWPVVHMQKKNMSIKANFGSSKFAYAEGASHQNSEEAFCDVTQEIRDTFGALPFNIGSDSDGEGSSHSNNTPTSDADLASLKTPGPPCRTPNIPKSLKEYNSEASIHYKLLPCYENFPLTGPDIRSQQANQDDEDDAENQEDEEPTEDHYALLVRAWEQKVFPTIRRRFRNEAERKDGLEQIRGALQLSMTDIARQTVEFLYEENGGIPRDLHLPTIEDIKEELAKFTIDHVRKGTAVVIRSPDTQASSTSTVIPKFAVRGMLKTFGLTGIVLDVDQVNELVQVETYLRSEGVLVHYWYPVDTLERPPPGYRKGSIIGTQILNTSNIHIHRELLNCESVLARMYCRTALLELINQCNSPAMEISCMPSVSTMAASAALLQQLDVENLQLLSDELLAPPQPHGSVATNSLLTAESPEQSIAPHTCSLSQILYHNVDKLKEELRVAIARAANQGEDYLIELSSQICVCLQTAPEMFHYEEFPVSETKISTDVYFPGAAFLVVSCKTDPKAIKKDTSLYKSPWARVYTYHSHIIRKTGQCSKQEVVCYPRDTSSSSNHSDQYMPVFIPTDRLHVRVGVSPPPGVILMIHALPAQFALAISYIEMLVSQKHNFEYCNPDAELHKPFEADGCLGATGGELSPPASNSAVPEEAATSPWRTFDSIIIPPSVLYHIVELIGGYLWRSDSPAIIKEYIFHLLAQTLRMVQISEGNTPGCKMPLILGPHLTSSFTLLLQLNTELKKLYEEETKHWPSGSTLAGSGIGLGIGDKGRFSTYFHSLMEVALSIAEVTSPIITGHQNAGESKPSMVSALQPPLPSGGLVTSKRKKLRAKRERDRSSTIPKRTDSPHYHSESESSPSSSSGCSMSSSPGNTAGNGSMSLSNSKPEDMLWFHRALTMTQILRYLVYNDPVGQGVILDAVQDAAQSLSEPTAHQRLLIITGIPTSLDCEAVKSSIRKICNSHGGLFKDELYLPIRQVRVKSQQAKNTGNQQMRPKQTVVSTTCHDLETQTKGSNVCETEQQLKGYCIIEVRSKAKVEAVHKSLLKNKLFLNNLDLDPDELVDIPKDELSVYTISSGLLTKAPDGDVAIDDYLLNKLILAQEHFELTDPAMLALTEIFHSCFISEQRMSLTESRHESGYICLGKEQIMMTSPSNLMRIFLLSMKPHKKTFTEQVDTVIWHYGIPKVIDKDDSDKKGKSVKKTTKASSKEKQALGSTAARMTMRDKKTKSKGAEKASKDLGSPEGPTKTTAKEHPHQNEKLLTLDGFLSYVREQIKLDVKTVWKALFTCGYDLHLERCACTDICQAHQMLEQWTLDMDTALVQYVNKLCYHLAIAPSRLHPHELYITEAERSSTAYSPLQGVPLESIRLRFALLKSLNNTLETFFLPLVDLRPAITSTFTRSMAVLLANAQGLIFFDTKMLFINRILNATALRKPDQAPPEIVLDPLEIITGERRPPMDTHFCQALRQLLDVSSNLLCVQLAAGGDPVYAFNVRYTGEEVHGTSGSFRHFLWQVARELESSSLGLFIQCPSSASHRSRGKLLLKPGPMTYAEEKMLQFFGQLLGVTIRADIPFGLDLLPVFWKNLLHVDLDPITDLQEADIVTYSYIKKFEMMESEQDLYTMYADQLPHFVYNSLNGEEVELIPNGRNVAVNWENHQHYVDQIRCLRMKELACSERMSVIRTGLATVFPIQLLALITPADIELRTCGLPQVNVDFLKEHTMYQVGLSDTDPHIQYFWAVLESFSQDELAKFVKFACNQERIPQTCPCKDGGPDTPHVPPYPMKIAPPDSSGQPDSRYIRVETCMFMIKLPQYSNQKLMKERLLYAIHCREDPLSG